MPLQLALLSFALGVVVLQTRASLPDPRLALFVPLLALSWCLLARRTRYAVGLLALAAGSGGFFYAAWRAEARLADELPPAWEGRDIRLAGVIDELPQPADRGTRFAFAVESVFPPEAVVPSRVSLAWYSGFAAGADTGEVPVLHAGERWSLAVRLKRPHGTVNPHGFDVEAWLLANDLRATGYVRKDDANRRIDAFAGRTEDSVARAREAIRDRILRALGERPYAGVIAALAIGDERAIPSAQWLLFNRTGIGHLISISGLHVTFFATLIGALVFWSWKRSHALTLRLPARKAAAIAGALAAFGYVLLAGFAVPAQRTLYMLTVAAIGLWLARPGTAAVVWLWALAVVLAYDPWASLTPGFWLSFGAVGLLLYTGVGRIGRIASWRAAVRAQAAITLGLIPLMLVLFEQVSIVSPLANAVAIPVVTFIVVPLTLASIALPWDGLLVIAHQVFAWLAQLLELLSGLPAAVWQQHAPPLWTALAGAIGVLWLLAPRGVPARVLGVAWLVPLFVVVPPPPAPGAFEVTVLDVGQGLAVLVRTHAHALLYDTGPRFNDTADAGNRIIAPMLRATGIRALDALVVSHQDSDHSGGALSLLQTVPVGWLDSSLPEQHPIVGAQRAGGAPARRCVSGTRWTWDGVEFATLYPFDSTYLEPRIKTNDLSCVIRVSGAGGSVLLTGDIEARAESAMLARGAAALRSDLLIVPHHGSRTSSTPSFIAAVAPAVAVYTPGYRNRFGHPRPEVVARYAAAHVRAYRTDYDGALTFVFGRGGTLTPTLERERERRYWRDPPAQAALPPLE
ncbi:MAG TPA: DNA internalization-related competence protein ComEC/Rec2 [Casimicrobiaceae bacterium]|nr:DNA internalization-related competence protein ComEC/Rec2 [Casimicrobiaceae bacterium]